jgi:drug/metabolite transporter (DMT)-like permease
MNPILAIILLLATVVIYKGVTLILTKLVLRNEKPARAIVIPALALSLGYGFFVSFIAMLTLNIWFIEYGVDYELTYWPTVIMYVIVSTVLKVNTDYVRNQ